MSMTDTFDVTGILLERVLQAIEALTGIVAAQEAATVTVPPLDLGEIVTAVNGLKPGASADDIANAVARVLQPAAPHPDNTAELAQMAQVLEQIEYRLRAPSGVIGGGVLNLPDYLVSNNRLKVTSTSTFGDNQVGTWGYKAGVSGTPTIPANAKVLGITAHGTTAGTVTINGGDSIPVPANSAISFSPIGTLITPTVVFTGTDGYAIEYLT